MIREEQPSIQRCMNIYMQTILYVHVMLNTLPTACCNSHLLSQLSTEGIFTVTSSQGVPIVRSECLYPDTAFMFIIAGLMLTKVFQNRHPDIHANAFIAFFSFAVVIFFTLLGIVCDGHVVQSLKHTVGLYICWYLYPTQHYDQRNPVAVRCSLLAMTVLMVAGFFTSFYYFHRWKLCEFYIHCTSKPVRVALFTL